MCGGSRLLAELAVDAISLRTLYADRPEPCLYHSKQEFIVRHGRLFPPKPFPAKYRKWMRGLHGCFENSLELAVESGELAYVEGFALPASGLPHLSPRATAHVWCVDSDGKVVDPTWSGILAGSEYCGLSLDKRPLYELHQKGKPFGLLFNDLLFWDVATGKRDWRKMLAPCASGISPERELPS